MQLHMCRADTMNEQVGTPTCNYSFPHWLWSHKEPSFGYIFQTKPNWGSFSAYKKTGMNYR